MEINELRTGNLLLRKTAIILEGLFEKNISSVAEEIIPVAGILENTVFFDISDINGRRSIEDVYPVPLTEEILMKCGLYEYYGNEAGKIYSFMAGNELISPGIMIKNGEPATFRNRKIYLHDLQNLHFTITGKELDVSQIISDKCKKS